ncbi:hydroperoxide isomerase ALOXE3-like isoform X1 [Lissotriton helveticus]
MVHYKIQVVTGTALHAKTLGSTSITLLGSEGEGEIRSLGHYHSDSHKRDHHMYHIQEEQDLGDILIIRLHKEPSSTFPEDSWFCNKVTVESPTRKIYHFPCYRWIEGNISVELPEGTASLASAENLNPLLLKWRENELKERRETYKWKVFHKGFPRCIDVDDAKELDLKLKYSITKFTKFAVNDVVSLVGIKVKGFSESKESCKPSEDIIKAFWTNKTATSEYLFQHWTEDAFFGYLFLNSTHSMLIKRCNKIPENFPVTNSMVADILGSKTNLTTELQNGKIFIVDYKIVEGLPKNVWNSSEQYMAAPLCLFYLTPQDEMIPLAIQITQTPGPENPIFLPSDNEWDWLLAKMWVRNADLSCHPLLFHLLRAHFIAEVFCISTLRNLPMVHPLFKLLIPHHRYILNVNLGFRETIMDPSRSFDKSSIFGREGILEMMSREMESVTYTSMCIADNLKFRGVDSLPNFYYRDDGLKIWSATERYVSSIVDFYYKSDESIQTDPELQAWVSEIFKEGFLERKSSGVPSKLQTRAELVKYVTMVIFTGSTQHAATNNGQVDLLSWMVNSPCSMSQPPPKTKGTATVESILEVLPNVGTTASSIAIKLKTSESGDKRPLGTFIDEYFTEEEPKRCIKAFQKRLSKISAEIEDRNTSLPLMYNYQNPKVVENSVTN